MNELADYIAYMFSSVVKIQHPSVLQLVPIGGTAYQQAVMVDSPLVYWRLNETSGRVAQYAHPPSHAEKSK